MNFIFNLTLTAIQQVVLSLQHNWPYLLAGILIAALLKRYINAERLAAVLLRMRGVGVLTSTVAAVATPLCSCGTTAVVLGMMASTVPWAPIVAFMVASPLTSPEELLYSAGLFGWPFAAAFFLASIALGLAGGGIAAWFENMGWLRDQARIGSTQAGQQEKLSKERAAGQPAVIARPVSSCGCGQAVAAGGSIMSVQTATLVMTAPGSRRRATEIACACSQSEVVGGEIPQPAAQDQPVGLCTCSAEASLDIPIYAPTAIGTQYQRRIEALKNSEIVKLLIEIYNSARQLLPIFVGFAFIGYFLNGLLPASWVGSLFGAGSVYSVPLAATLGLPLYINTEGSLPLVHALLDQGMSQGAALAFMISGAGSSVGALAGALMIARWRVVALVVGILWLGAILTGYLFNLLLVLHAF
jgi:uncharacterized membrane protein YraQ (UPF0718 family)